MTGDTPADECPDCGALLDLGSTPRECLGCKLREDGARAGEADPPEAADDYNPRGWATAGTLLLTSDAEYEITGTIAPEEATRLLEGLTP